MEFTIFQQQAQITTWTKGVQNYEKFIGFFLKFLLLRGKLIWKKDSIFELKFYFINYNEMPNTGTVNGKFFYNN